MDPQTLQTVNSILSLVSVLEPPAQQLIQSLVKDVQGKSVAEIAAMTDAMWNEVKATAQTELA